MFSWIRRLLSTVRPPLAPDTTTTIRTLSALHAAGLSPRRVFEELARDPRHGDIPVLVRRAIAAGGNPHDALITLTRESTPPWRALGACWSISRTTGAPLGLALEALAEALADISRTQRGVRAALAGPRATMRLVMVLPVIGVLGGELGGQNTASFLLGSSLGLGLLALGALMMAGAWWWLRLLQDRASPPEGALGLELDLFAIATGGGALPEKALALVDEVCEAFTLPVGDPDALRELVALSRRAGIPVAGLATSTALLRRDVLRTDSEERLATLGVSVVVPLGLLVLPAFVVVAVIPMAVGLWQGSLG